MTKQSAAQKTISQKTETQSQTKKAASSSLKKQTLKAKVPTRKKAKTVKKKVDAKKKPKAVIKKTKPKTTNAKRNTPKKETVMTNTTFNYEQMMQDAANASRENVEAMVKSSSIFAKGMEEMMRATMTLAQQTATKQSEYMKKAMGTRSLNDLADMQTNIAKQSYNDFMTSATKISEMSVETLTTAIEPINAQMTKTMQKASSMAA